MRNTFRLLAAVVLVACLPAMLSAQARRRQSAAAGVEYDVTKETTLAGTISGTQTFGAEMGDPILILTVQLEDQRKVHVFLGPPTVAEQQAFTFPEGALVEVKAVPGFRLLGEAAMLAREVRSGDKTLVLRDKNGKANWGGD